MKVKPKVTVVTIVRNDPQGFLITARSILQQDYKNIEWIVVDGASTDGTSDYVKNLAPAISNYIIEKDTGIYNAMNKGIDLITGDWVMFMNADDVFYDKHTISQYVKNISESDDVIYSDVMRREDGIIHQYRKPSQYWAGMAFDHQSAFVRAALYKKYKYDESYKIGGDLNFFSNLRSRNYSFRKLKNIISCIKPFDVGASSSYFERAYERVKVLRKYFDGPNLIELLFNEFNNALKAEMVSEKEYKQLLKYIGKNK
jgi:glycosyltransferase involved in cell wall biosynthesis